MRPWTILPLLNPPENALVLSVDEKPSIQALERATGYVQTGGQVWGHCQRSLDLRNCTNLHRPDREGGLIFSDTTLPPTASPSRWAPSPTSSTVRPGFMSKSGRGRKAPPRWGLRQAMVCLGERRPRRACSGPHDSPGRSDHGRRTSRFARRVSRKRPRAPPQGETGGFRDRDARTERDGYRLAGH